jgi:hypothetical protein
LIEIFSLVSQGNHYRRPKDWMDTFCNPFSVKTDTAKVLCNSELSSRRYAQCEEHLPFFAPSPGSLGAMEQFNQYIER